MLHFESSTTIQAPVETVWAFHERDDIFDLLKPPRTRIEIVMRKGKLRTGSRVELRIPVGPLRVRWLALHIDCEEGKYFTDEQIRGPFRYWVHKHGFEQVDGGATRLTDHIDFSLPGGAVVDWVAGWAVKVRLRGMFRHRHEVTRRYCEGK